MNETAIFRSINEAVLYCRKRGYQITYAGLYYAIKSHMDIFRHTVIGTYYPKIYVDELDEYIGLADKKPSENHIRISEAVKEFKMTRFKLYSLIKSNVLIAERFGRGKGTMYVKRENIEQYRTDNKKSRKAKK